MEINRYAKHAHTWSFTVVWLGTATSIKCGRVKMIVWTQTAALVKWCGHAVFSELSEITTLTYIRRVWRYYKGKQNPYIEEHTTCTMAKRKKYKRTKNDLQNIHIKTKDRVTRTSTKSWGELRCSGRESSSYLISENRCGKVGRVLFLSFLRILCIVRDTDVVKCIILVL
jgi:hypothetical protein